MEKINVLFVCVHNSARSQMAEAFLKLYGKNQYQVESAGLESGTLNPLVVEVMREIGIDISKNPTKKVFDLYHQGKRYDWVITVCDESSAQRCPVFFGFVKRDHWSFSDPSAFTGEWDEKLAKTREVRNEIQQKIKDWLAKFH